MYEYGGGCEQSHDRAVEWHAKAAEQGDVYGQSGLGFAYFQGYGVPQDSERALELIKLSVAQGVRERAI